VPRQLSADTPEALLSLAREALTALQGAGVNVSNLRRTADFNQDTDAIIAMQPAFPAPRQPLLQSAFVAERSAPMLPIA
jgi:hypothetical protein